MHVARTAAVQPLPPPTTCEGALAAQVGDDLGQRAGGEQAGSPDHRGLLQVLVRQQHRGAGGRRRLDDGEHPANGAQRPVEGELTEQPQPVQRSERDEPGGDQHAGGDRHVEHRAFLALLGRRQVDHHTLGFELAAEVADRRENPLARLAYGGIGEAHDRQHGKAGAGVDLDLDRQGIDPAGNG